MSDFWYPFYPSKFKAGTRHLTAEQDGIYRRLIDEYMETREPLPDNDIALARIAGVNEIKWLDAKRILSAYFSHSNGMLYHKFCDQMLDIQDKKSKRRSASAEKAAKKRWENHKQNQQVKCGTHAERNANAMRLDATDTDTDTDTKKDNTPLPPKGGIVNAKENTLPDSFLMPDGIFETFETLFERFWKLYPNIRAKGNKTEAKKQFKIKLKKGINYETIGRGIARYKKYCENTGEKNKDMFRWFRDELWNNEYETNNPRTGDRCGLSTSLDLALADKNRGHTGRAERLAELGIDFVKS